LTRTLVLASLLTVSSAAVARAQSEASVRVVFVFEGADDPLLTRIEVEVAAVGFDVVESREALPLEELARREHAAAAIRVLPTRTGVEVWMADATSGRSLLRQVVVDERPGGPDEGLVALQTSELLRTSLLSRAAPKDDARAAAQPPGTGSASGKGVHPKRQPLHGAFQLGAGALYSPGGAGTALQLWGSVQRPLGEQWGAVLDLSAPLLSAQFSGPEGEASAELYSATLGAYVAAEPSGQWFANAGAGAGVAYLRFSGDAVAPLSSDAVGVWTGAALVRGQAGVEVARWLQAGATAVVGASFEQVAVQFAGNQAGQFGRTFLAAFLFAGVPWY
jgi:hypothetical protein